MSVLLANPHPARVVPATHRPAQRPLETARDRRPRRPQPAPQRGRAYLGLRVTPLPAERPTLRGNYDRDRYPGPTPIGGSGASLSSR